MKEPDAILNEQQLQGSTKHEYLGINKIFSMTLEKSTIIK